MKRKTVALGEEKKFVRDNRCGNCGGMLIAYFHPTDRELYEMRCAENEAHVKIISERKRDNIRNRQAKDYQEVANYYRPKPEEDADQSLEDIGY